MITYFKPYNFDPTFRGKPIMFLRFHDNENAEVLSSDGSLHDSNRSIHMKECLLSKNWIQVAESEAMTLWTPQKASPKPAVIPPDGTTAYWVTGPDDPKSDNAKPTADQLEKAACFFDEVVKSRHEQNPHDQTKADVLAVQHGGNHYKGMKIQPVEYAKANDLDCLQFSVVKYITRHRLKAGAEDLKKCIHFAQMALKMDYGVDSTVEYSEEKKAGN